MNLQLSLHAKTRIQQRAIRHADLDRILEAGTLLRDGSVVLLNEDVDREIATLAERMRQLQRLRNAKLVLEENTLITVYKATRKPRNRRRHDQD